MGDNISRVWQIYIGGGLLEFLDPTPLGWSRASTPSRWFHTSILLDDTKLVVCMMPYCVKIVFKIRKNNKLWFVWHFTMLKLFSKWEKITKCGLMTFYCVKIILKQGKIIKYCFLIVFVFKNCSKKIIAKHLISYKCFRE